MKRIDIVTNGWSDYHLIDCGDSRKLEQFGTAIIDRPDPQALWHKGNKQPWSSADAQFIWSQSGEKWKVNKDVEKEWTINYNEIKTKLSFSIFKHIGIFPEHESQWQEIESICRSNKNIRVLNLFGYTGVASLVSAKASAKVTHIDASKQTIATLKENIKLSKLPEDSIRIVCEDALKYAKRLVQRGERFEVVVMDPPAFGRGPKGEVWKVEEKLPELLELIPKLLSENAKLVILNGYASGYSARAFGEMLQDVFPSGDILYGDVGIQQKDFSRVLPTGIYAKWVAK